MTAPKLSQESISTCKSIHGNRHSMLQQESLDSTISVNAEPSLCCKKHAVDLTMMSLVAVHVQVAMMDPVIAADGHTYERSAIQHWLQGSSLSPVTGHTSCPTLAWCSTCWSSLPLHNMLLYLELWQLLELTATAAFSCTADSLLEF